jgi:regulator of protease activity HflC (stomatin/prohibitin superfamily)
VADIQTYPFFRHLRSAPTTFVRHARNGDVAHEGVGQSFWFRPLSAVLSEAPVDDRELPLLFHARTSDYQDVVVQATVTYRIAGPELAVQRIDFGIDPRSGQWRATPLEQLAALLTELAQQYAIELVAGLPLRDALADGPSRLRDRIESCLAADDRIADLGLAVVAVRVGPIRPEPDLEKALGMPARELVQQEADRATFERRALAVESERAIAENELHNQIELAKREEELIAQRGQNEGRRVEDASEAARLEAASRADTVRLVGEAEAEAEAARLAAYASLEPPILLGLALKELAANMPQSNGVTLAPDVIADALAHVAGKR